MKINVIDQERSGVVRSGLVAIKSAMGNEIGDVYVSYANSNGGFDLGRTPKTWKTVTGAVKAFETIASIVPSFNAKNFVIVLL